MIWVAVVALQGSVWPQAMMEEGMREWIVRRSIEADQGWMLNEPVRIRIISVFPLPNNPPVTLSIAGGRNGALWGLSSVSESRSGAM